MSQHRLAPEAETGLDGIWRYIAQESGSIDIADRLIDTITAVFLSWLGVLIWAAGGTKICGRACEPSPLESTLSSTVLKGRAC